MPSDRATSWAVVISRTTMSASSAVTAWALSMCCLGITRTWVGAVGLMSRKAYVSSVDSTSVDGTSPARIRQNRQSSLIPRNATFACVDQGADVERMLADLAR